MNTENAEKPLSKPASKNQSSAKKNGKLAAGKRKATSVAIRSLKEELAQCNVELATIIIGLSAHAMNGDAVRAKEAGCNDYLTKPVDEDLLVKKIQEYLE